MADILKPRRRPSGRLGGALAVMLATSLAVGCASSSQSRAVESTPERAAVQRDQAGTESAARMIESMSLREDTASTFVDLKADKALVWTSYRDTEGNLIIELPNSEPGPNLQDLRPSTGLVAEIRVDLEESASRPLTRLTVRTRGEADHNLSAEGSGLHLELVPVEGAAVADSLLPLPEEEVMVEEVAGETSTEVASASDSSGGATRGGDLEVRRSEHRVGNPATILSEVMVLDRSETTVLKISGDGEFVYSSFRLENPDRFVLDIAGVVNTVPRSTVPVDSADVDRVRVAQFKPFPQPVSRVVFDLTRGQVPFLEPVHDGLVISFGAAAPAAATTLAEDLSSPNRSAEEAPELVRVTGGDPQDSAYAEAEVVEVASFGEETPGEEANDGWPAYEAEGQASEVVVQEEVAPESEYGDPQLDTVEVVEFSEPELPAGLDGGEEQVPTDVALFEAAEVEYREEAAQSENSATRVMPEVVGGGGRVYSGDPITMSLKDADIKDVLRSFSGITGLNVVVHPGVKGSVTVELTEVPWDQALDLILKINSLNYVLEGNIMRIASTTQLQREAQERRRLAAARAQEIPLTTIIRSISYADARRIARLLTTAARGGGRGGGGRRSRNDSRSIISSRGSVAVDERTNRLIIKEVPGNMNTVLAIIDNLDTAEPQVLIEARIVETNKTFSRSLGINWGITAIADGEFGNTTGLAFPNRGSANGGVRLFTGGNNGFLDVSLGNVLDTFVLDASLQAAENEGLVSVVAAPRITVLNNERAEIQSGLQIPVQTVANNTVSVQFVNATLNLTVTPQVTAEGTVLLDILVAKREPQLAFAIAGATNAPISTRQARTRVLVRDGDTTVIGGIYEISNNRGEDRVPGLANIPLLGHLFKNRRRSSDNEELLIFITPRIIQL